MSRTIKPGFHPRPRSRDDRSMTREGARTLLAAKAARPTLPDYVREDAAWRLRWIDCAPAGAWHGAAPLQDKAGVPCGSAFHEYPGSGAACNPHIRRARAKRGLDPLSGERLPGTPDAAVSPLIAETR